MTIKAKNRTLLGGAIVAVMVIAATLLPMVASSEPEEPKRDIHLVIRDMAFYLDGKGQPNPTLQFRRGERIRLIVTSEDAGMDHDFVVSNWKVATRTLTGRGQEDAVTIKVPRKPGSEAYFCTPHSAKMRGEIRIE